MPIFSNGTDISHNDNSESKSFAVWTSSGVIEELWKKFETPRLTAKADEIRDRIKILWEPRFYRAPFLTIGSK